MYWQISFFRAMLILVLISWSFALSLQVLQRVTCFMADVQGIITFRLANSSLESMAEGGIGRCQITRLLKVHIVICSSESWADLRVLRITGYSLY